jgi:hypothetical protein
MKTISRESSITSRRIGPLALALIPALVGCNRAAEPAVDAAQSSDSNETAAGRPPKQIDHAHPVIVVDTSAGQMTLRLNAKKSPGTVQNFLNYVSEGFYDNTLVHFVAPDSMIVAGG